MRGGNRLIRGAAALALCAMVSSCSVGGAPRFDIFSLAGPRCVDAHGPNSTPEEIVDAQLKLEITDPATGEKKTMAEMGEEMYKKMAQLLPGLPTPSPGAFKQKLLEMVYRDVPSGGDAAFAKAICGMQSGWERAGLGSSADAARVAATPHVLRGAGRAVCQTIAGSDAEDVLAPEAKQVKLAKSDPAKFKQSMLHDLDEAIDSFKATKFPSGGPFASSVGEMQKTRDKIADTPAPSLARGIEAAHEIKWMAVRHQCPTLSRAYRNGQ
ncbi:MAG TPA: hypothetical protein VH496_09990 [Mycobacterium sp.]|jgi:hypothetical protein